MLTFTAAAPLWLCGCASTASPPSAAPTRARPQPTPDDALSLSIDAYVAQFGRHWGEAFRFNGYVLVTRAGDSVYSRGFGVATADGGAFQATTVFPIASNTKGFTAASILKLQEQGKLSVDDRVGDHLPDYQGPARDVTIHQLLTHTAGLPSYTTFEAYAQTQSSARSVQEVLDLFRTLPLLFSPGDGFHYSNSGYALLGAIIEATSGSAYGAFLASDVISPAGLEQTEYRPEGHCQDTLEGFAVGDAEQLEPDEQNTHMSNGFSAGGVRSTANDLAAWGDALLNGRVLQQSSMVALFREERENYAYGWEIAELNGHRLVWHGGVICGFRNQVVLVPDRALVLVAWTNNRDFAIDELVRGVASLTLGEEPLPVDEPELVELSAEQRQRIVGTYRITDQGRVAAREAGAPESWLEAAAELVVVDRDGDLRLDNLGGLLSATADDALVARSWRISFSLERDDSDRVTTMHMRQGPASIEYARASP